MVRSGFKSKIERRQSLWNKCTECLSLVSMTKCFLKRTTQRKGMLRRICSWMRRSMMIQEDSLCLVQHPWLLFLGCCSSNASLLWVPFAPAWPHCFRHPSVYCDHLQAACGFKIVTSQPPKMSLPSDLFVALSCCCALVLCIVPVQEISPNITATISNKKLLME